MTGRGPGHRAAVGGMAIQSASAAAHRSAVGKRPRPVAATAKRARKRNAKARVGLTGPSLRRVPSLMALRGAERHSRLVRTMRVVFPAIALLLMASVAFQALIYKADDTLTLSFAESGEIADDLTMVKLEISALFGAGNPFRITAETAHRDKEAPARVVFNKPEADITLSDGAAWLSVQAARGVLDTEAKTVGLEGGIDLYSDYGYELHTKSVNVDLNGGEVSGPAPVTGQAPMGTVRADGFSISSNGDTVRFTGNVRVTAAMPTPPSG